MTKRSSNNFVLQQLLNPTLCVNIQVDISTIIQLSYEQIPTSYLHVRVPIIIHVLFLNQNQTIRTILRNQIKIHINNHPSKNATNKQRVSLNSAAENFQTASLSNHKSYAM